MTARSLSISRMPIDLPADAPTILIARAAFERSGLARSALDARFNLTPDEFRVEGNLIALGPLVGEDTATEVIAALEEAGLVYYDDFFEMPGGWPPWLRVLASSGR